MSKRLAVALLGVVTGGLLFGAVETAPVGALLVAAGAYLLAVPYLRRRATVGESRRGHRRT